MAATKNIPLAPHLRPVYLWWQDKGGAMNLAHIIILGFVAVAIALIYQLVKGD